jgi:hypothetical protein
MAAFSSMHSRVAGGAGLAESLNIPVAPVRIGFSASSLNAR